MRGILITPKLLESAWGAALEAEISARGVLLERVSERDIESASDTDSPQGVLGVADIPEHHLRSISVSGAFRIVLLDGLQDPGNTGTILRTAAALGARAVIALPGTVDLWNPKVIRGAMGVHFHLLPMVHATHEDSFDFLKTSDVSLWGASADGDAIGARQAPERLAIVLGNEGAGLSDVVRDQCDFLVSIPIEPGVESLNVAVAAGIILHELRG